MARRFQRPVGEPIGFPASTRRLEATFIGCQRGTQRWQEKTVDTSSIFLQLSKYEKARPATGYPLGGPFCRAGRRTSSGHPAFSTLGASHRRGGRRDSGGVGHSRLHALASSGKTEASRLD